MLVKGGSIRIPWEENGTEFHLLASIESIELLPCALQNGKLKLGDATIAIRMMPSYRWLFLIREGIFIKLLILIFSNT